MDAVTQPRCTGLVVGFRSSINIAWVKCHYYRRQGPGLCGQNLGKSITFSQTRLGVHAAVSQVEGLSFEGLELRKYNFSGITGHLRSKKHLSLTEHITL